VDPKASPPNSRNKPEVLGLVWAVAVWVLLAGNVIIPVVERVVPLQLLLNQKFGFWITLGTTIIITLPIALVSIERVHRNRKVAVSFLIWSGLFLVGLFAGMLFLAFAFSNVPT
jgi:hypothetical protein